MIDVGATVRIMAVDKASRPYRATGVFQGSDDTFLEVLEDGMRRLIRLDEISRIEEVKHDISPFQAMFRAVSEVQKGEACLN